MTGRTRTDVFGLLGLAQRAGALVAGTDAVRRAVQENRALLVLFAGDASGAQLEKIEGVLKHRSIPRATLGDRAMLGTAIGRSSVSAVALTSAGLARQVQDRLESASVDAGQRISED
ncbi:MAG: ribosomal L7Ae/L30e/S12e/Gadd45 family protein [Gemmatimonadota bacterium]|nr:ribosomal L7Ae/L30e/S12e/Gadd45 family protein [Gemmatimonadota bacterium]